jgi:hypothetical protein
MTEPGALWDASLPECTPPRRGNKVKESTPRLHAAPWERDCMARGAIERPTPDKADHRHRRLLRPNMFRGVEKNSERKKRKSASTRLNCSTSRAAPSRKLLDRIAGHNFLRSEGLLCLFASAQVIHRQSTPLSVCSTPRTTSRPASEAQHSASTLRRAH